MAGGTVGAKLVGVSTVEQPVLLVGPSETISYANPSAHSLLGYELGSLQGISLRHLVPKTRHQELRNLESVFSGAGSRRLRSSLRRKDGRELDVTVSLDPCLNDRGQVIAVSLRYDATTARSNRSENPKPAAHNSTVRPTAPHSTAPSNAPPAREPPADRLATASQLLHWLTQHLSGPAPGDALEAERDRTRALFVLTEASSLILECERELRKTRAREA